MRAFLLVEKNEHIADLRAVVESQKLQIEAANRQAAEATAALREYLKMQAKALPSGDAHDQMKRNGTRNGDQLEQVGLEKMGQIGTETAAKLGQVGTGASTRNDAETLRENRQGAPIIAATGNQAQDEKSAPLIKARREMRPLWKVILGVR